MEHEDVEHEDLPFEQPGLSARSSLTSWSTLTDVAELDSGSDVSTPHFWTPREQSRERSEASALPDHGPLSTCAAEQRHFSDGSHGRPAKYAGRLGSWPTIFGSMTRDLFALATLITGVYIGWTTLHYTRLSTYYEFREACQSDLGRNRTLSRDCEHALTTRISYLAPRAYHVPEGVLDSEDLSSTTPLSDRAHRAHAFWTTFAYIATFTCGVITAIMFRPLIEPFHPIVSLAREQITHEVQYTIRSWALTESNDDSDDDDRARNHRRIAKIRQIILEQKLESLESNMKELTGTRVLQVAEVRLAVLLNQETAQPELAEQLVSRLRSIHESAEAHCRELISEGVPFSGSDAQMKSIFDSMVRISQSTSEQWSLVVQELMKGLSGHEAVYEIQAVTTRVQPQYLPMTVLKEWHEIVADLLKTSNQSSLFGDVPIIPLSGNTFNSSERAAMPFSVQKVLMRTSAQGPTRPIPMGPRVASSVADRCKTEAGQALRDSDRPPRRGFDFRFEDWSSPDDSTLGNGIYKVATRRRPDSPRPRERGGSGQPNLVPLLQVGVAL